MGARLKQNKVEADPVFKVWRENWPAVRSFVLLGTQWRRAGMRGLPTGLDYAAIEPTLRLAGIKRTKDMFGRLRLLEGFALEAYGEVIK